MTILVYGLWFSQLHIQSFTYARNSRGRSSEISTKWFGYVVGLHQLVRLQIGQATVSRIQSQRVYDT